MERKLQVKQKTEFAFNFDLVGDEDGLEGGQACKGGNSNERNSFRFGFNPTENPVGLGASVGGKQHRSGGDVDPRADDDFVVRVSGTGTAPRSAQKKGKRKGGGKKKKGGKGKGKGAENLHRNPTENELSRKSDEVIGSRTKDAAIVVPPCAVATDEEECQPDGDISLQMGKDSSERAQLQQQPETDPAGLAQPDGCLTESLPMPPAVARPPPGLTLESWKDPALTGEERRRRRFGRGVRNMAAIHRSRDARRGAGVEAEDLLAEVVADNNSHGVLAKPDPDRIHGQPSRGSGSSVFAFGFDIGISFNDGS